MTKNKGRNKGLPADIAEREKQIATLAASTQERLATAKKMHGTMVAAFQTASQLTELDIAITTAKLKGDTAELGRLQAEKEELTARLKNSKK